MSFSWLRNRSFIPWLLTILVLNGCDMLSKGAGPSAFNLSHRPSVASGVLSSEDAAALTKNGVKAPGVSTLPSLINKQGYTPYNPSQFAISRAFSWMRNQNAELCLPSAKIGFEVDADHDQIPATASMEYNCPESSVQVTGKLSISDQNDNLAFPKAGYRVAFDKFGSASSSSKSTIDGFIDIKIEAKTAKVTEEIMYTASNKGEEGGVGLWVDATFTMDGATIPNSSGTVSVNGFMSVDSPKMNFTLKVTAVQMKYGGCGDSYAYFNTGDLIYEDGAGNTLIHRYNNCAGKAFYNGVELTH